MAEAETDRHFDRIRCVVGASWFFPLPHYASTTLTQLSKVPAKFHSDNLNSSDLEDVHSEKETTPGEIADRSHQFG